MDKTTKSNPAAFQKSVPKTLLMILNRTIKEIFNGQFNIAKNMIIAELLNYLAQYKKMNQLFCNLCNLESPYFLNTSNKERILYNSICPNCSSRKRHRGLYEVYKKILLHLNKPKILHFAPEPVFYKLFQTYDYMTADSELMDVNIQLNIQDIDYPSESFDLILCNHVLEHVPDHLKALKELERILRPLGILILTVPGNWDRDNIIEFEHLNWNGHYRDYGLEFIEILKKHFRKVKSVDLYKYNFSFNLPIGLTPKHDLAFLCHKV